MPASRLLGIVTVVAAGAMLAGCLPFRAPFQPPPITPAASASATGTTDADVAARATAAMSAPSVREHQVALQRIADANGGNRAADTPGYAASVTYVRDSLAAAGYRVQVTDFSFTRTVVVAQAAEVVTGAATPLAPVTFEQSPSLPAEVIADLRVPRDPLACSIGNDEGLRGTIVLAQRGTCTFAAKSRAAAGAGALALLIFDPNSGTAQWHGTLGRPDGLVPTASLTGGEGRALQQGLGSGPVRLRLDLRTTERRVTSQNVIADWPTADPQAKVVMVGAHLDSVAEGPGINDNASGVALVLELAKVLAAQGSSSQLRIGLWGAEELGLIGSRAWVDGLTDAERSRIAAYLNFDMVTSPNGVLGVYGTGGPRELLRRVFSETLAVEPVDVELNGASDHAPFADKGIAVAGIFTGASEPGAGGAPADPCYHRACDTLDSVSGPETQRRLDLIADAAALATLALLRDAR